MSFQPLSDATPPLVTVVIPCYNAALYVAEAIESVLAQTYSNLEIVVVDDGSADGTGPVAQSYPITYIYQKNRGIAGARNTGIAQSSGSYLLFLDHDDRLLPEAVEIGVRLLEAHPACAMAVGEHRYIGPDGNVVGRSSKKAAGYDHYRMLLQRNFIETPCSVLHRRSVFDQVGLFDPSVHGAEDHELYLRIARQFPVIAHEALVAEYRLHAESASRNAERMLLVSHRVFELELPYVRGDREKLRLHRRGVKFVGRHYGRRLTNELMASKRLMSSESLRKLKLLGRHYALGLAAVAGSRLIPAGLLRRLFLRARIMIEA